MRKKASKYPHEKMKLTFTQKVKRVVAKIPKGSVRTYKEVASLAGNPKAARAVARIMSKNYDVIVPCHRVIRSDGGLGGYNRGGIKAKREILLREGVIL
jgi:O-6-methylguanine DNA methyltransferase